MNRQSPNYANTMSPRPIPIQPAGPLIAGRMERRSLRRKMWKQRARGVVEDFDGDLWPVPNTTPKVKWEVT